MRIIHILAAAILVATGSPAAAQDGPSDRQLALAERYLDLSQGTAMKELLSVYMEETLGKSELSAEQREWLTANFSTTMVQVMDQVFDDLADDVASLFTEEELRAIIAFLETPVGQSFTNKSIELGLRIQETMTPRLMTGVTQLMEKYCARFECEADQRIAQGKAKN